MSTIGSCTQKVMIDKSTVRGCSRRSNFVLIIPLMRSGARACARKGGGGGGGGGVGGRDVLLKILENLGKCIWEF